MNEKTGQFRSAAFGGFHRQDVLDYIERITKERQEERAALETAAEDAAAGRSKAEEELAALTEQTAQLTADQTALQEEILRLKEELEEKNKALAEAEAQNDTLRSQVMALEPSAESWKRIKDTAGNIEVSAHERAQITMQEAKARAAEIRADAVRWVLDIQYRCDKLQRDLKSSIVAAEAEMDAARDSFAQTEADMEGFQAALSDLVSGIGENR